MLLNSNGNTNLGIQVIQVHQVLLQDLFLLSLLLVLVVQRVLVDLAILFRQLHL